MQVLDTHVINSANGTVTVEFKGEGRELVSVRMADGDGSLDGDHAVLRAKEIMVQLTAFEIGGSTVDTRQSGDSRPADIHSDAQPISLATGSQIRAE